RRGSRAPPRRADGGRRVGASAAGPGRSRRWPAISAGGGRTVSNRVVAHFLDGRVLKGASYDVAPAKATCHLQTPDGSVEVRLSELKALFFVKDLSGNPAYQEANTVARGDMRAVGARRVQVRFRDGEQLTGLAPTYSPEQP